MINKKNIPDFTRVIVEDYLSKILNNSDYDYLVALTLYGISRVLCMNRVCFEDNEVQTGNCHPNMYIMTLADSGFGKDRSLKVLKDLM